MIDLYTTDVDPDRTSDCVTKKVENWIKHVPDIRRYSNAAFDWDSRSMARVRIRPKHACDEGLRAWWFMCKGNAPTAGISLNKNPLCKSMDNKPPFGDVFIFRWRKDEVRDRWARVTYETSWLAPEGEAIEQIIDLLAGGDDG